MNVKKNTVHHGGIHIIMKYSFKRKNEISLREFEQQMREQERALSYLMSDQASADEAANYVRGIMESGRPCRRMPDRRPS